MTTEHVRFDCHACGLVIESDESPDRAEAAEAPYVRLGWCKNEHRALVIDVQSSAFRGHCPDCGQTVALLHFPLAACPRCGAAAQAKRAYVGPL